MSYAVNTMNSSSNKSHAATICLLILLVLAGFFWFSHKKVVAPAPAATLSTEDAVRVRATEAIVALVTSDIAKFATLVDPKKGIRFSINSHVDVAHDKVLTASQLVPLYNSPIKYTWGVADGSGEKIILPFKTFVQQKLADHDYPAAPEIIYDGFKGTTNVINNVAQVYPTAHTIEFYFPGFDAQNVGMDWRAVRMVFEQSNGAWYIVGIISDNWTI